MESILSKKMLLPPKWKNCAFYYYKSSILLYIKYLNYYSLILLCTAASCITKISIVHPSLLYYRDNDILSCDICTTIIMFQLRILHYYSSYLRTKHGARKELYISCRACSVCRHTTTDNYLSQFTAVIRINLRFASFYYIHSWCLFDYCLFVMSAASKHR